MSEATPRVTVVTATYNRPETLRLAIGSVLAQTCTDFEYWVIGDACDERTAAVIAEFDDPRLHYHNLPTNTGNQSAPNNAGCDRARGTWIAYLGHDDLWFPWHLATLLAAAESSGAALVYSLAAQFGAEGVKGCRGAPYLPDLRGYQRCPPSSWLVRRDWLQRIGGWLDCRTLDHAIDANVLYRLHEAGAEFQYAPRLTVLKFASRFFPGGYRTGVVPPADAAARLAADPAALELEVLTALARLSAEHFCPVLGWRGWFGHGARLLGRTLGHWYGWDRWPLPTLRLRHYQRLRRHVLTIRGLDREHGEG